MNVNTLIYAGRLTRDPEMKFIPNGNAVCTISVASNRTWGKEGEKKEEVTFLECKAWGNTGELIGKHFKKGQEIFLTGRITIESWEDSKTKERRSKMVCTIESFQFVGSKSGNDESSNDAPPRSASKNVGGEPEARRAAPAPSGPPEEEDDVPFRAFLPAWLGWLVPSFAR